MRINYYNGTELCTVIIWHGFNVEIQNFTDNVFLRAFGCKKNVAWEDLESFLESRCFPRTRANVRDILENMGLDHYDVFAITKITNGRMAEDDQWLEYVED